MPSAIWTGAISFGLVQVPVKLVGATKNKDVSFNQLEKGSGARIRYRKVSDATGEEVGADLGECLRDLAVDMGQAGVLGLEGVEDAVGGVVELERVPGDGALFCERERATALEERSEFSPFVGLGLEER